MAGQNNNYGALLIPALGRQAADNWWPALEGKVNDLMASYANNPLSGEQMLPAGNSRNPPNLLPFYSNLLIGNSQGLPNLVQAVTSGSLAPVEKNVGHSIDQQLKAATDFSDGKLSPGDLNLALQLATGDLGPDLADRPFYSPLEAFTSLSKDSPLSATPEVWKNYLQAAQKKGAFKNEEAEDTGLWNWLDQTPPDQRLRREDVRQFVADNRPQLYTYTKGGNPAILGQHLNSIDPAERTDAESFLGMAADQLMDFENGELIPATSRHALSIRELGRFLEERLNGGPHTWWDQFAGDEPDIARQLDQQYRELGGFPIEEEDPTEFSSGTKYKDYSSPGGSDYRETLLRVPEIDYVGPHWNEPDIMMHIRSQTMPDVAGKPAHHVEEVQSDFHQEHQGGKGPEAFRLYGPKGRKIQLLDPQGNVVADTEEGFNSSDTPAGETYEQTAPHRMLSPITRTLLLNHMASKLGVGSGRWGRVPHDMWEQLLGSHILSHTVRQEFTDPPAQSLYLNSLYKWMTEHPDQVRVVDPVPETTEFTPWSKSWPLLGMKQAMKEANDKGLDRVSFTPGEIQNLRYGNTRGSKEQAGMAKFYDERLVNDLNKFLKKYGSKVQREDDLKHMHMAKTVKPEVIPHTNQGKILGYEAGLRDELLKDDFNFTRGNALLREAYPSKLYPSREEAQKAAEEFRARHLREKRALHYFDITPALKKQIENGMPLY